MRFVAPDRVQSARFLRQIESASQAVIWLTLADLGGGSLRLLVGLAAISVAKFGRSLLFGTRLQRHVAAGGQCPGFSLQKLITFATPFLLVQNDHSATFEVIKLILNLLIALGFSRQKPFLGKK